jgi:asparagine synthase (glutamine-hydrolysing)
MPGITGIIGRGSPEENEHRLRRMSKCMLHETFYSSGSSINVGLGSWLAWVALKGSFSDGMPLWNETRDIRMLFSGEDYSDPDRIEELRRKGHVFESGNASYLVHAYEEWGYDFFQKLNGRFCGVILDDRRRSTILFNDRYGLSRIYIHEKDGMFFFSSEAKSLLAILPELRHIEPESLAETFSFGCVLRNKCLFKGISLLPGASLWTFKPGGGVTRASYFCWDQWERLEPLSVPDYYRKLKETWIRILPRYLRAAEPVGISLTGGKDSRMIMAWALSPPGSLPCYTFGGIYRECLDVKIARRVAQICRQPYQVVKLGEAFLRNFPYYAERIIDLTDGCMNVSGSEGLFVNRYAREIAPIRLTGNYGQEILRSSIAFKPYRMSRRILDNDFGNLMDHAAEAYHEELGGNLLSFIAFKQVPWHHYSRLASELSQLTLRSPYLDNEMLRLAYQTPREGPNHDDIQLRLTAEGNAELGRMETDRGLRNKPIPIYTGLKSRLQNLTFMAEYAYDYGMPHALAKFDSLFKGVHLERLFLGRHKYYHFRIWYRDILSGYVKEILLDPRTRNRSYLNSRFMEKMVDAHIKGTANYTMEIHVLLTAELIHRRLIENFD